MLLAWLCAVSFLYCLFTTSLLANSNNHGQHCVQANLYILCGNNNNLWSIISNCNIFRLSFFLFFFESLIYIRVFILQDLKSIIVKDKLIKWLQVVIQLVTKKSCCNILKWVVGFEWSCFYIRKGKYSYIEHEYTTCMHPIHWY